MNQIETDTLTGARELWTRLDTVFAHAAIGLAVVDLVGRFVRANPALERWLGYGRGELAGMSVDEVMHVNDLEEAKALMEELLVDPHDSYRLERRYRRKDGVEIWMRATVSMLPDAAGLPAGSAWAIEDVTDHRFFEQSVVRLSREYEVILNTAGWGIIGTSREGKINFVNPSAARMLNWEVEELLGQPVREMHHSTPNGTPYREGECAIYHALRDGLSRQGSSDVLWRRDGTSFPVEYTITPIVDDGLVQGVVVTFMDITEQLRIKRELQERIRELTSLNKRLEAMQTQLLQSEKMAAIGQLAAGVAHEINNPISFVSSNLNALEKYNRDLLSVADAYALTEQTENATDRAAALNEIHRIKKSLDFDFLSRDVEELIAESKDGLARVKKIVLDLKDFSHVDAVDEWTWVNLHQGLDSTINIVWNELKYKCELKKEYGVLPEILCLPSQLNQVFMNMLVNAGHAIEKHGTIRLRTGCEGDKVWVEIADTGKGIAPEHLQRIFEPFFTTKPVGKGTGLGLSLSYGIMQKHQGSIEVQSEVGCGSTFRIWLPVAGQGGE